MKGETMDKKDFKESMWHTGWIVSGVLTFCLVWAIVFFMAEHAKVGYLQGKLKAYQEDQR